MGVVAFGQSTFGGNVGDKGNSWFGFTNEVTKLGVLFAIDVSHWDVPCGGVLALIHSDQT